ncbi:DNRLRE domain-containing protein [Geosporobacter ferrireducens]|uniref:Carbohydrate-binding module family 96 domain-containing protein n=1 Tax=Geosporobacter ferrireducens TaxID=1424294 RepID=A0A1D8GEJ3_9FIRM|nr:DNRLRE domain-containing protein [Geosporobacter ferrireducens]AOT69321.1 hypothetical protein Gferi_06895 [Geosporobacter ferrireducens]
MLEVIEKMPVKDTTINSAMAYENYGDYYALFVGKYMGHSIYRSLLQFDLPVISSQGIIEKVELLLYITRNDKAAFQKDFEIYRITEKFDENRINYASKPAFDKELYKTFTIKDEINTYIKIDITKLFSDWYCGKYPNHGLLIKAVDEDRRGLVGFYSKDTQGGIFAPKLQIYLDCHLDKDPISTMQIAEKNKRTTEEYYKLGNHSFENGDYAAAFENYKKALADHHPNAAYTPKLYFRTVLALEKMGRYDEALEIITQGLKLYPDFTDLVFIQGSLLCKQGKTTLAIKLLHQCMKMGEAPLHMNCMAGVESYRALHLLSQIYYELDDYEEAYHYCLKALHTNPRYMEPLYTMVKILSGKQRDIGDIKAKIESFLGTNLDGRDYMILGDIFFTEEKYTVAYAYFSKAEVFIKNHEKILYGKGMCQLCLKQYNEAYKYFEEIRDGEIYEEAVYRRALCKILSGQMDQAVQALGVLRNPENNHKRMVYYVLKDLLDEKTVMPIADDKKESEEFLEIVFTLLDILIQAASPEVFEKSLQLLNLIEHDEVLLRLAKLYYKHRFYNMAYQEFLRSIKIFDKIDLEGLAMMKRALEKIK